MELIGVREEILECYPEETFMFADGFDGAIIGIDSKTSRIVYSICECTEILMNDSNMTQEEAVEYFYFNVECSYVGEQTPIWVYDVWLNKLKLN